MPLKKKTKLNVEKQDDVYESIVREYAKLDFWNDDVIRRRLTLKFCDLTAQTAESIGQRLIKDCLRLAPVKEKRKESIQKCLLFDIFVKSIDFFRYSPSCLKIYRILYKNLNEFLHENENISTTVGQTSSQIQFFVVLFNLVELDLFLRTYFKEKFEKSTIPEEENSIKSLNSKKSRHFFTSGERTDGSLKNLSILCKLVSGVENKKQHEDVLNWDFKNLHNCELEHCHLLSPFKFCIDRYFRQNLHKYQSLIVKNFVEKRSYPNLSVSDLFAYVLRTAVEDSHANSDQDSLLDFLLDVTIWEEFQKFEHYAIRSIFCYASICVEHGFADGHDVSVWVQKLTDDDFYQQKISTNKEQTYEKYVLKLLDKFLSHFHFKSKKVWQGRVEDKTRVENLRNLLQKLIKRIPLDALSQRSAYGLFAFFVIVLKIIDFSQSIDQKAAFLIELFRSLSILFLKNQVLLRSVYEECENPLCFLTISAVQYSLHDSLNFESTQNIDLRKYGLNVLKKCVISDEFVNGYALNSINLYSDSKDSAKLEFIFEFFTHTLTELQKKLGIYQYDHLDIAPALEIDEIFTRIFVDNQKSTTIEFYRFLPCMTSLYEFKRKAALIVKEDSQPKSVIELKLDQYLPKILSKTKSNLKKSTNFTEFYLYFTFLSGNFDIFPKFEGGTDARSILRKNLLIRRPDFYANLTPRQQQKFSHAIFLVLQTLTGESEVVEFFECLRAQDLDWYIFVSRHALFSIQNERNRKNSENSSLNSKILKGMHGIYANIFRRLCLWFTLSGENEQSNFIIENGLHLALLALKDKALRLNKNKLVSDIVIAVSCLDFSSQNFDESKFELSCDVLNDALKLYPHSSVQSVPALICIFSRMQHILVKECGGCDSSKPDETGFSDRLVSPTSKFCRLMLLVCQQYKIDYAKLAPYFIADFVAALQKYPLHRRAREILLVPVYGFLDICDEHAVKLLATNLSDPGKEIFRVIYEEYKKYFKYKGDV